MIDRVDVKFFKQAVGLSNIGRETDVDISAKCPICGDGKKRNSKRLHIYNKGTVTNINCFNGDCPVENKTVYSFLRDFYPDMLPQYKRETFGNKIDDMKSTSALKSIKKIVKPVVEEVKPVVTQDLSPYMLNLKESDEGIMYLRNRGIEYRPQMMFRTWYFGNQDLQIGDTLYKITNSIVIPLYYKDEMYGFYSRSITGKEFVTRMDDVNIGYKIWNWFTVNKDEPVYIFEGIFDAISSGQTNIIALLGAKLPEDRLKELKQPVFCLDNDTTGFYNAIEYAKRGYKVFVQPKDLKEKDFNELMLKHPELDLPQLIQDNTFVGISAMTRIKGKM